MVLRPHSADYQGCRRSTTCKGSSTSVMSGTTLFCWTFLLLAVQLPAMVVARLGPGAPSMETILSPDQKSACDHDKSFRSARTQAADTGGEGLQEESIVYFHHRNDAVGSPGSRRFLVGSSPPTCRAKCGLCEPCKPVHIAIGSPHGVISETEYYPEVWRCQCGNRLYMP